MKRFLPLLVLVLATPSMPAVEQATKLPSVSETAATVADPRVEDVTLRPDGIPITNASGSGFGVQLFFPVVVNSPGLNNTFFETDIFFINDRNVDQEILVEVIHVGETGPLRTSHRLVLSKNSTVSITDFLGQGTNRIDETGVGSLLVTAVLPGTNTVDPNGKIWGLTRIWTNSGNGTGGTTSFTVPFVLPGTIHGSASALAVGGRENQDFRSNVALTNLDPVNAHTFTVTVLGTKGVTPQFQITVPPHSMQYVAIPNDLIPSDTGYFTVIVAPEAGPDFPWNGAIETADNKTGDGWHNQLVQLPQ
jgi:hypothetical protein